MITAAAPTSSAPTSPSSATPGDREGQHDILSERGVSAEWVESQFIVVKPVPNAYPR